MSNIIRFGVSLEEDLLDNFDRLIKKRKYTNRSEAIRDLIRQELLKKDLGVIGRHNTDYRQVNAIIGYNSPRIQVLFDTYSVNALIAVTNSRAANTASRASSSDTSAKSL